MERSRPLSWLLFILCIFLLGAGCAPSREEFLWQLGVILFVVYLFVLTVTVGMPKLHRRLWFQRLTQLVRKPMLGVAGIVCIGGTATFVIGLTRLGDEFGPQKLLFLMGFILIVTGMNLFLWVYATTPEEKTLRAKIVTLSISFGVGLAYVMFGAQLISG